MGIGVFLRPPLLIPPSFESYDALGWNLARGEGFTLADDGIVSPHFFRTPGYPLFLAAVYALFGHAPKAVYAIHIVLHLLTVVLIFVLARRCFNERVASLASLLVAVFPLTTMYIPTVLPEVLSTFLLALSLWLFKRVLDKNSPWLAFLTGAIMAYSALVRPVFALLSLLCFAGAWWVNRRRQGLLRPFVVLHLGFLLVWLPWVARNYWLSESFIPLSTEAPYQFWLGTLSVEKYATRHWKNPDYYFQLLVLENRLPHFHDDPKRPSIIELNARNPEQITPIRLHYRTGESDRFTTVDMSPAGAGRFRTTLPPQPFGTRVSYFVTSEHPLSGRARLRYPRKSDVYPERYFFFETVPDVVHEIGGADTLDIHDVAALVQDIAHTYHNVLKSGARSDSVDGAHSALLSCILRGRHCPNWYHNLLKPGARLDSGGSQSHSFSNLELLVQDLFFASSELEVLIQKMSGPGAFTARDIEASGEQTLRLSLNNEAGLLLPLHKKTPALRWLIERGGLDDKRRFAATVSYRGPGTPGANWTKLTRCGLEEGIFSSLPESSPCVQRIGFPSIHQELRRNRAYMKMAWINLKRDFWENVQALIFRIPRLWLVLGTTSEKQTYQVRGSSVLYPLLTLGTSAILVLGILGFVVLRKGWRKHWIIAVPIVYLSLVHAPFHAEGRYGVPGRPFYLIYTAVALIYLWPKVRGLFRRRREDTGPQREPPASSSRPVGKTLFGLKRRLSRGLPEELL